MDLDEVLESLLDIWFSNNERNILNMKEKKFKIHKKHIAIRSNCRIFTSSIKFYKLKIFKYKDASLPDKL